MRVTNLPDERRPLLKIESTSDCAVIARMASRSPQTGRSSCRAGGEDLAALATASGDNGATTAGGHPGSEAVGLRTLPVVGLIRTLHVSSFLSATRQPRHRAASPAIIPTPIGGVKHTTPHRSRARRPVRSRLVQVLGEVRSPRVAQKPEKLWIVWKTQDARLPKLWITHSVALSVNRASARIGAAHTGVESVAVTLKMPDKALGALQVYRIDRTYVRVIHSPSIVRLRRVRAIHRNRRVLASSEASGNRFRGTYTHCTARIRVNGSGWWKGCPHMWKVLLITREIADCVLSVHERELSPEGLGYAVRPAF